MVIERHLTRNRQRNVKRVRRSATIARDSRRRRSEHDRICVAESPLPRQVHGRAGGRIGKPQQPFHVIESDETAVRSDGERMPHDTGSKRRVQRPQRDGIDLGFSAFSR